MQDLHTMAPGGNRTGNPLASNDNVFPVRRGAGKRARRGQGGRKVVPRFLPALGSALRAAAVGL